MSSMIDKTVDEFTFQAILGKGGMGVVYRAVDTSLDRLVAIKMIDSRLTEDEAFLRRFRSEAKALAKLNHPNIVGIYNLRESEFGLMMVMEYIEGKTLSESLRLKGPIFWKDALPIFEQLLQAINQAHKVKVIHRDIKPSNVMLTPTGTVKVTDFGLAKIQKSGEETLSLPTGGTLYYMAPEQIQGQTHIDRRTDIYALGMTLYEVLAGRTPFEKTWSDFSIQKAIIEEQFPPPSHYNSQVPKVIADIIVRSIEKEPKARYQTVEEILLALSDAVEKRNFEGSTVSLHEYTSPFTEPVLEEKISKKFEPKPSPRKSKVEDWYQKPAIRFGLPAVILLVFLASYFLSEVESPSGKSAATQQSDALTQHSAIIQDLALISDIGIAIQKLGAYSRDMLIATGKKEDFEPLDGCYMLLYDNNKIFGIYRFQENAYFEVKTGRRNDDINTFLKTKRSIWIQDFSHSKQ